MTKLNFSADEMKIFDLTRDLARNEFSLHIEKDKVSKRDLENYLRDKIKTDILQGATLYQAFRRNKLVLFEIVEEIVNVMIGEEILDSPFINEFVEVKNRALGDTTAFYAEGGLLEVATFAGNHWDVNRQSLDIGDEITLPKEWAYIRVYDDLERFLLGIVTIEKVMDKIYKSVNKFLQDRIYAQFGNVSNAVPSAFVVNGNSEDAIGGLADKVMAAGGYSTVTIAGTRGALRRLANAVPDKMFANSQKEAKATTGSIGDWEGHKLMVIPQTLQSGTFTTALDDKQLYILGGDTKPIKLEFFGDTRTKSDEDGTKNNDQTIDMQIQTKFGMGLVLSPYFGLFNFPS